MLEVKCAFGGAPSKSGQPLRLVRVFRSPRYGGGIYTERPGNPTNSARSGVEASTATAETIAQTVNSRNHNIFTRLA